MIISEPPWADPAMVNAAIDLVCDVRDLDPAEIRRHIAKIPPDTLASLAIVTAAMVDADAPLDSIRRWDAPGFVGARRPEYPTCINGHPLTPDNRYQNHGGRSWRCRTCIRERYAARSRDGAA